MLRDVEAARGFARNLGRVLSYRRAAQPVDASLTTWLMDLDQDILRQLSDWGLVDSVHAAANRTLNEHVGDYEKSMLARGRTAKHAKLYVTRVSSIVEGAGLKWWGDVTADRVLAYLNELRKDRAVSKTETVPGISAQTYNFYLSAIKNFFKWAVRERRVSSNPVEYLEGLNVASDVRRLRRALLHEEVCYLLNATAFSEVFRSGLTGKDRAMIYQLALETGLRWNEIKTLRADGFNLKADPPVVTVMAAYAKNRREDTLPLRPATAAQLKEYLARVAPNAPAFSIPPTLDNGAEMLQADMEAARKKWIEETQAGSPTRKEREKSDFLRHEDAGGQVVDFHSLRHTFITSLARAGVAPKTAQDLARHSDINLTLSRYSHTIVEDRAAALAALPDLTPDARPQTMVATGTDGAPPANSTGRLTDQKLTVRAGKGGISRDESGRKDDDDPDGPKGGKRAKTQRESAICEGNQVREDGAPGLIRTADLRFRKPPLYPAELRAHFDVLHSNLTSIRKRHSPSLIPARPSRR